MSLGAESKEFPEVVIGKMTVSDLNEVMQIERLSFPTPWSRGAFISELVSNKYAEYITARMANRIVGYAGMWLILDEAHVTNIAVHPEFRAMKIGHRILTALEQRALEAGMHYMTLEVRVSNEVAQNLYKKHGFVAHGIRPGYYRDTNEDALIMWKKLVGPEVLDS